MTESIEMAELVGGITYLREKQLTGGGLSDDEVREGIRLLHNIRMLKAGKAVTKEAAVPLEKLF